MTAPCAHPGDWWRHRKQPLTPLCPPCRDAEIVAQRDRRKRTYLAGGALLVDSTGTRRRLQALARIGWPYRELGARLGCDTANAVGNIVKRRVVHVDTAAKVAALYEELCMTPGPSPITRARATAAGWSPPLSWDCIDTDVCSWEDVERAHEEALWEQTRLRKMNQKARARDRAREVAA